MYVSSIVAVTPPPEQPSVKRRESDADTHQTAGMPEQQCFIQNENAQGQRAHRYEKRDQHQVSGARRREDAEEDDIGEGRRQRGEGDDSQNAIDAGDRERPGLVDQQGDRYEDDG